MSDFQLATQMVMTTALFAVAVWFDYRTMRIPNLLCLLFLSLGLTNATLMNGTEGLLIALAGAGVGLGLLLPFYAMRLIGAGDVKLMIAVGALIGPTLNFWSIAFGIIAGGVISMVLGLRQAGIEGTLTTFRRLAFSLRARQYFSPQRNELGAVQVPYAPSLATGWVIANLTQTNTQQALHAWFQVLMG